MDATNKNNTNVVLFFLEKGSHFGRPTINKQKNVCRLENGKLCGRGRDPHAPRWVYHFWSSLPVSRCFFVHIGNRSKLD